MYAFCIYSYILFKIELKLSRLQYFKMTKRIKALNALLPANNKEYICDMFADANEMLKG